nr:phage tail fiber protein [uncultured Anaeromusa sp.]
MAKSFKTIRTFTTLAGQTTFNFGIPFLRAGFIKVYAGGNEVALNYLTDYSITSQMEAILTTSLPPGTQLKIKRETATDPLVSWVDASVFLANDLTLQQAQMLHIQEEVTDAVQNDSTEAAAQAAQAANDALASKNAAALSETAAKTSETNSRTSETNSKASELAAKASETAAKTSETNSKASELAAKASETAAKTSETNAGTSASQAVTKASEALASANVAEISEDNAKVSEDNAKASETAAAISANIATANGGLINLPNHIVKGGKVTSVSGLDMTHGFIESVIRRKLYKKAAGDVQTLPAKRRGLFTIDESGTRGTLLNASPLDFVDNNTIGFWELDGSASIPNQAYGKSTIAVVNPLVKAGTLGSTIPGLYGKDVVKGGGGVGNGYNTSNNTNATTGNSDFCWEFSYTAGTLGTYQGIIWIGSAAATKYGFQIGINATGNIVVFDMTTIADTGFTVVTGGEYEFAVGLYSGNAVVYVNGFNIYTGLYGTWSLAGTLAIFREINSSYPGTVGAIHYLEYRKQWRTRLEITEKAAKLLFPVCWDGFTANSDGIISQITIGYPVGNMTSSGGIAVAFDGITSQTSAQGACYPSQGTAAYTAWIGKDFEVPVQVSSVTLKGSTEYGFSSSGVSVTITLRGSNDNGATYDILDTKNVSSNVGSDSITLSYAGTTKYKRIVAYLVDSAVTGGHGTYVAEMVINGYAPKATRKNLASLVPTGSISLGMFRTTATTISYNDAEWQWARREGAAGGNRRVIQDYKAAVVASQASVQFASPFGNNAAYDLIWFTAIDSIGTRRMRCHPYFNTTTTSYGAQSNVAVNGKVGCYLGTGGWAVSEATWLSPAYVQPEWTCLEPEEEVPDVA